MTTELIMNDCGWHERQDWRLLAKDIYRRNLPRQPQRFNAFRISDMKVEKERVTIERTRDGKKFYFDLKKMLRRNYCYCKLYFIDNIIDPIYYAHLREYREGKAKMSYEELRDQVWARIENEHEEELWDPDAHNDEYRNDVDRFNEEMPEMYDREWEALTEEELENKIANIIEYQERLGATEYWSIEEDFPHGARSE